jgi:signal transduction histidine kinase
MDEFVGIASHELRTPLTSITANVQLARRQLERAGQQVARLEPTNSLRPPLERSDLLLERTERQIGRLDRLVGDPLDVSRIQAGKLEMRPEPCDLLEIVRDMVQEQRAAWPARSIEVDLPQRAMLLAIADPDRIGQVVTNFLSNALKYSMPDQPISVRVQRHGAVARVEVRDHGPGLTVDQQAHLFEQFYRMPSIEQQSGSGVGLGLGLHICRTIVERHDGREGVKSKPGAGSTFWLTLPLPDDQGAFRV